MSLASIFEFLRLNVGIAAGLVVLVVFALGYAKKVQIGQGSKMGLNLAGNSCPGCGKVLPRIRRPANLRQILWGGSTCPSCENEYDKWMKPIENDDS